MAWTPLTYTYLSNRGVELPPASKRSGIGSLNVLSLRVFNQFTTPITIEAVAWKYYIVNASWNVVVAGLI